MINHGTSCVMDGIFSKVSLFFEKREMAKRDVSKHIGPNIKTRINFTIVPVSMAIFPNGSVAAMTCGTA